MMKIGPIEKLALFGGGPLMVAFAKEALKRGIQPTVFAVKRHLEEQLSNEDGLCLEAALDVASIPTVHARDVNVSPELQSLVSEKTMGIGLGETYRFDKETIARFQGRLFDFMVIRLPQYRGGAHFTWQILREDKVGCWNIQVINDEMVPGVFDSGELIKTREYGIPSWARIPKDYFQLAHEEGLKLFIEFMDEIQSDKTFAPVPLNEANRSYFPRLSTIKQAFIDWSWHRDEIARFICAFDDPYPGASTFLGGQRVFLKRCQVAPVNFSSHPFLSGLVYRVSGPSALIATRSGSIVVEGILAENGKDLVPELKAGQRFHTPVQYLEASMSYQASYDTEGLVNHD
ncbi:MAG: hypothetical protein ACE5GK_00915 [Nitrospiria bacterium]